MNPKQERFCREYVIDLNGTQAAIRAGYSEKTANEQAAQLLAKLSIKNKIKELQNKIQERTEITADMVVNELAKIGFSNVQDYISSGNEIADISKVDKKKAASVGAIETVTKTRTVGETEVTETTTKFKLYDKVKALEQLGRHLGIFEKDNSQKERTVQVNINKKIIEGNARA